MVIVFFFFKQKTAYEMRISDWSSDVCSSDLRFGPVAIIGGERSQRRESGRRGDAGSDCQDQRVVDVRRRRVIAGQGVETVLEQLGRRQAVQLEIAKAPLVLRTPVLAEVEGADEQVAAPLEHQMRGERHPVAVILGRDHSPARNGFHQFQSGVVHGKGWRKLVSLCNAPSPICDTSGKGRSAGRYSYGAWKCPPTSEERRVGKE